MVYGLHAWLDQGPEHYAGFEHMKQVTIDRWTTGGQGGVIQDYCTVAWQLLCVSAS
jgi:hypothetical protein